MRRSVRCIISRIWISTSGVLPRKPPDPWWIMIRRSAARSACPVAPAASSTAPIEAAWPMQIVLTGAFRYCIVS